MDKILDLNNFDDCLEMMAEYGQHFHCYSGKNKDGESVEIDTMPDRIVLRTFQHDDRTRVNIIYADGDKEEYFEDFED